LPAVSEIICHIYSRVSNSIEAIKGNQRTGSKE
jgi:hypothetical protein